MAEPYIKVIQRLVAAINNNGSHVALAPMPRIQRTSEALYQKGRHLFEIYSSGRKKTVLLSELESLGEGLGERDTALPGDAHFNAATQSRIARAVAEALSQRHAKDPKEFWPAQTPPSL